MDVLIQCPHCKAKLKLMPEYLGKKLKCRNCQGIFQAPTTMPTGAAAPATTAPKPVSAPPPTPAAAPRPPAVTTTPSTIKPLEKKPVVGTGSSTHLKPVPPTAPIAAKPVASTTAPVQAKAPTAPAAPTPVVPKAAPAPTPAASIAPKATAPVLPPTPAKAPVAPATAPTPAAPAPAPKPVLGGANVEALIKKLQETKDNTQRLAIIRSLGAQGPAAKAAFKTFEAILDNEAETLDIKVAVTDAVGDCGDKDGFPLLEVAMALYEEKLQYAALVAMGKIKDPRAFLHVVRTLKKTTNHSIKEAACVTLGELRDPAALDIFNKYSNDYVHSVQINARIGLILLNQKVQNNLQVLKTALRSSDDRYATVCAKWLYRLGARAEPCLEVIEDVLKQSMTTPEMKTEMEKARLEIQKALAAGNA